MRRASLLAACSLGATWGCSGGGKAPAASPDASQDAAAPATTTAYVWGYPRVVTQRTLQTLGGLFGVNTLFSQSALSTAGTAYIVAPNQDTLYSVAVLDLRSDPQVLTVPDVTDRYWVFQFLDAWTNSFHYVGTRATGGTGGTFVITPPGWTGSMPAGTQAVASPTPQALLLGRYLVKDAADVATVAAIPRTLQPLHALTGGPAPAPPPALGAAPGTPQDVGSNGAAFFDELGDALSQDPPASDDDKAQLLAFASLGIGPGRHPAAAATGAALAALQSGVTGGTAQIQAAAAAMGARGWTAPLNLGTYANDWLVRATVADDLWGANVPAEAVYAYSRADTAGQAYSGASSYLVHFAPGQLPAIGAQGFWSISLYGPNLFFVPSSTGRNAIGDRTPGLTANADGSLDVLVQNAAPEGSEGNWLPAPTGAFVLLLRLYLPLPSVLGGTYVYPTVTAQ